MAGKFQPTEHMTKLQGRDYLEVRWRLVWFRETHPTGSLNTELVTTEPSVIVRATVITGDGGVLATGYGTAPAAGKGTWTGRAVEKAETAAIGRALAHAGFGTQFDADDEGDNLADSPVDRTRPTTNVAPTPSSAEPTLNWSKAEANDLVVAARAHGIEVPELLRVLDVEKFGDYPHGYENARAALTAYVEAKAKAGEKEVVF